VKLTAKVSFYGLQALMGQHREWGGDSALVVRLLARTDRLHDPYCVSVRPLDFGFNGRSCTTVHEQVLMMDESYFPQRPYPVEHVGLLVAAGGVAGMSSTQVDALLSGDYRPPDNKVMLGVTAVTASGWTVEARQFPARKSQPLLTVWGPNDTAARDEDRHPLLDAVEVLNGLLSQRAPRSEEPPPPPDPAQATRDERIDQALQRWLRTL
jgi:hypothetical protein